MNKTTAIAMATLLALSLGSIVPVGAHGGTEHVNVLDFEYDPPVLAIEAGTTVEWTNVGPSIHEVSVHLHNPVHEVGPHEVPTGVQTGDVADNPTMPFGMVMLDEGESFEFTFDTPGVYVINCNLGDDHDLMKQAIVVF